MPNKLFCRIFGSSDNDHVSSNKMAPKPTKEDEVLKKFIAVCVNVYAPLINQTVFRIKCSLCRKLTDTLLFNFASDIGIRNHPARSIHSTASVMHRSPSCVEPRRVSARRNASWCVQVFQLLCPRFISVLLDSSSSCDFYINTRQIQMQSKRLFQAMQVGILFQSYIYCLHSLALFLHRGQ